MQKQFTICIIYDINRILLGMKKRGFGEGRWNGFGGKVQPGETIEAAVHRETYEESGLQITQPEKIGVISFSFENDPLILETYVFRTTRYTGEPQETEEMKPQWFSYETVPYPTMWPSDRVWLPLVLQGKKFRATFHMRDKNTILRQTLEEITDFAV